MKRTRVTAAMLAAALLSLIAAGCGDSSKPGLADQALSAKPPKTTLDGAKTPAPTGPTGPAAPAPSITSKGAILPISTNLKKKPAIPKPKGSAPKGLVVKDIVTGTGKVAKPGSKLTVNYVGVSYADGKQFDASWDRKTTFPFTLSPGSVIPGWVAGVAGMKVGGRRELVIPPALAYGPKGQPPAIGPNATLVFVIDLVKA